MTDTGMTGPRHQMYMPIDELEGNSKNPKAHDLEELQRSAGRFGFIEPITLDERTQTLISGHGRVDMLKASHAAGVDPPEGIVVAEDGRWWAPVNRGWASSDDAEAEAALIAVNALVPKGGWHVEALTSLLENLSVNTDQGLAGVGYDGDDLDRMMADLQRADIPPTGAEDESEQLTVHWSVMIECESEAEQVALLERLMGEGLTCRALIL